MPRGTINTKNKKGASGAGTIRRKTVKRNGKVYTYWEARVTTGFDPGTGKQIQKSYTGKTQQKVAEKLRQVTNEIDMGTYIEPSKMKLGEWLDIWKSDYLMGVKDSTVSVYVGNIETHIKPALGAMRLDKAGDQDYYILTLAAVARELRFRGLSSARVFLAAGLPLTWVSGQRDSFKAYLLQKPAVDFTYRGAAYHIEFAGAEIYPQGFSAIADRLHEFRGVNMLCDIGNGTMNVMYIRNGKPDPTRCFTEKYGVQQCMLVAREKLMQQFGSVVDDAVIEDALRFGKADIGERYLSVICECAKEYTAGILKRLRDHEYNPDLMRLYVMGGGSCLIKNFAEFDQTRVTINSDVCATAKGYERLAEAALRKRGGVT